MSAAPAEIPNPFDPSSSETRYAAFAELRAQGGVHKLPTGQWFAVSHAAVEKGLSSVEHFVGSFGDTGHLPEEQQILAAIPEPRHGKIRKLVNSVFAYHHAVKVEPFVEALASELIGNALEVQRRDGSVCMMEHYARPLPSAVIGHLLGVPADDFEQFARWSDETLALQGAEDGTNDGLADIHPEFGRYLEVHIEARSDDADAPDDFTTRMLRAEVEGERLSRRAVRTQLMFLIMAGNETTRNWIGNVIHRLAQQPEAIAQLRADRDLVEPFLEEAMRMDTPVQLLARTCTQPIELDGQPIAAGERVLFSVASANRDEQRFEDPTAFRVDRDRPREHIAFGAGPHICPGMFLARLEARIAIETLLDRVQSLALAPGDAYAQNPVFWALGPQRLRCVVAAA